jgi:hypothetical protein
MNDGCKIAYSDLDAKVGEEASALAALYRNVSSFPDPKRTDFRQTCANTRVK